MEAHLNDVPYVIGQTGNPAAIFGWNALCGRHMALGKTGSYKSAA
jgi:hypothetical protein